MSNYKIVTAAGTAALEKVVHSLCALGYNPQGAPFVDADGSGYAQAMTGTCVNQRTVTLIRPALPDSKPVVYAGNGMETFAEIAEVNNMLPDGEVDSLLFRFNGKDVDGDELPLEDGVLNIYVVEGVAAPAAE